MKKKRLRKKRKLSTPWILLVLILVIALIILVKTPTEEPSESTTTIPETTTLTSTTMLTTTTLITTTMPVTTTLENATTTIQVRKPISVVGFDCDRETDTISLTIDNRGNTRIEEDEIDIYINDEYKGTFGKAVETDRLSTNSIQGNPELNIIEVISPSNSVRLEVWCY